MPASATRCQHPALIESLCNRTEGSYTFFGKGPYDRLELFGVPVRLPLDDTDTGDIALGSPL